MNTSPDREQYILDTYKRLGSRNKTATECKAGRRLVSNIIAKNAIQEVFDDNTVRVYRTTFMSIFFTSVLVTIAIMIFGYIVISFLFSRI